MVPDCSCTFGEADTSFKLHSVIASNVPLKARVGRCRHVLGGGAAGLLGVRLCGRCLPSSGAPRGHVPGVHQWVGSTPGGAPALLPRGQLDFDFV